MTGRVALPTKIVLSVALALSTLAVAPVQPVSAHCPGLPVTDGNGRDYAAGYQFVSPANGIYAAIEYTNPVVCNISAGNAFSLEGVNLCNSGGCNGWVQVGWLKWQYNSSPHWYCEAKPVGYPFQQYHYPASVTPQAHIYWFELIGGTWYCKFDTTNSWIPSNMNWWSGTYFTSQGETNSIHTQIGRTPYPQSILFYAQQYRTGGSWYSTDLYDLIWDPLNPYWVIEPTPGQMRNGTYTPH